MQDIVSSDLHHRPQNLLLLWPIRFVELTLSDLGSYMSLNRWETRIAGFKSLGEMISFSECLVVDLSGVVAKPRLWRGGKTAGAEMSWQLVQEPGIFTCRG